MVINMNLKKSAQKLKRKLAALSLVYKHPLTPLSAKILCAVTLAYALSPIDLIPDFIPVLGYLDDLIILPFLIWLSLKAIPPEVMALCEKEAETLWKEGKPKRWYYAVPIIILWVCLGVFLLRVFVKKG